MLIIGAAGGVGTFAVQVAKAFGAEVTGVCSTTKVELVRSIGADEVVDYTRDDFADGARLYDLILDTAGRRPLSHLRRALAPHGTLVIVGGEGGGRWMGGFDRQIFRAPLLSLFVGQTLRPLVSKERREDLQFLGELIEAGKVTPVIDQNLPAERGPRGHPVSGGGPRARQGRHHRLTRDRRGRALPSRPASVDEERGAVDEARRVGGDEDDGGGDLLGVAVPSRPG